MSPKKKYSNNETNLLKIGYKRSTFKNHLVKIMFRLYYWFKGAPENRAGGPWWYKDFESYNRRVMFLAALKPFLKLAYFEDAINGLPSINMDNISPPRNARRIV